MVFFESFGNKNGQSAVEFLILVGAVFFFFVVFLYSIQVSMGDKIKEGINLAVKEIAIIVQDEISLAVSSSDGYYRNFEIPNKIGGLEYNASLVSGSVYVRTLDGEYALSLPVLNVTGDVIVGNNVIRRENGIVYLNS